MLENNDIKWALQAFVALREDYDMADRYYDGDHRIVAVSERFVKMFSKMFKHFAVNICTAVVDAPHERLKLSGFTTDKKDARILAKIQSIHKQNNMDKRAGDIHKDALRYGDSYAIVWPDALGRPIIYAQDPRQIVVDYSEELPGLITRAARMWTDRDGYIRINLYFPDRTEKYITTSVHDKALSITYLNPNAFIEYTAESAGPLYGNSFIVPNPWNVVPIFHFNNGGKEGGYGYSELKDVYPLQDSINKLLIDLVVNSEFSVLQQRWATGLALPEDPLTGKPIDPWSPGAMMVTDDKDAKFGQFTMPALEGFVKTVDHFKLNVAQVTGIPSYYFQSETATIPSGESLKTVETRLSAKVYDRQVSFGSTWEQVLKFALTISGGSARSSPVLGSKLSLSFHTA